MARSGNAKRANDTDSGRRRTAPSDSAAPRIQARLHTLNEDWTEAAPGIAHPRPRPDPAPRKRRSASPWPLILPLAAVAIGLALARAGPWIDRAEARFGRTMVRTLAIDCLGPGKAAPMDGRPSCR